MRIKFLFLSIAFASVANANPATSYIQSLAKALPPGQYAGRNNAKDCEVKVELQNGIYAVTVSQFKGASGNQQMSFVINNESKVSSDSYVNSLKYDLIETAVSVETGRTVGFQDTYGTFAEVTMGLDIRLVNSTRSEKDRKIWVTKTRAGNTGGSGPACIILLP